MTREEKKNAKRAVILNAAAEVFQNRRFDEVTLDEIAVRAGVGKGTIYLYFSNKEDLFVQMAVDGVEAMAVRMREIAALDGSFRERFFLFGHEVGAFVEKRSIMFRLMYQTGSTEIREEFFCYHRELVTATRGLLQKGGGEGAFRSDFTLAQLHCLLIGPLLFRFRLNEFNQDQIEVEPLLRLFWDAAAVKEPGV